MTTVNVDREALVQLVAFVDTEHETTGQTCEPMPGYDCVDWCDACRVIRPVPLDVLEEARDTLRRRGFDRPSLAQP